MDRRSFLSLTAAGLASAALPALAFTGTRPPPRNPHGPDPLKNIGRLGDYHPGPVALGVHPIPIDHLSEKARGIAAIPIKSVTHQTDIPMQDYYRFVSREHGLPHENEFFRLLFPCLFFSKVCYGTPPPEEYQRTIADTFGVLVDLDVLGHGVLCPPSWIRLARGWKPETYGEEKSVLFFFAFPDTMWHCRMVAGLGPKFRPNDRINSLLGDELAVLEGYVGHETGWDTLRASVDGLQSAHKAFEFTRKMLREAYSSGHLVGDL